MQDDNKIYKQPIQLTSDGEVNTDFPINIVGSPTLQSTIRTGLWLLMRALRKLTIRLGVVILILGIAIAITLFVCYEAEGTIASLYVVLELAIGWGILSSIPPVRSFFDLMTFPDNRYDKPEPENEKAKKLKHEFVNESDAHGYSVPGGLFLLYPQHSMFIKGARSALRKYAFSGEIRFVYSFVFPVFSLVSALFLFIIFVLCYFFVADNLQSITFGISANAAIIDCSLSVPHNEIKLTFRYAAPDASGRTIFYTSETYRTSSCSKFALGTLIPIKYFKTFPQEVQVIGATQNISSDDAFIALLLSFPFLLFFLFSGFVLRAFRSDVQFRHLRRNGIVVFGQIASEFEIKGRTGSKRTPAIFEFKVQFKTPDERMITYQARIPNHVIGTRTLPGIDTPVAILFMHDHLYKLL